jgi:hypothetical protein
MHASSRLEIKKMVRRDFDLSPLVAAPIIALLIMALSMEFYVFARVQDIWADEATQLSGITLNFWEMLRWLSGAYPDSLGVPADRMPPVSYILDWLWLHLFGPSEIGFRLFHSAIVIAGTCCLAAAAWRELGRPATIVSLGFLVLSPKLIQTGVEIRAYPIFFAITCAQVAVFMRLVADPTKLDLKLLTIFAVICLLAIYTHYYGIVSSCTFFLVLGISFLRRFAALTRIVGTFVIVIIASLALIPFVSAAARVQMFEPDVASGHVIANKPISQYYLTYLLRLVGDPANMISVSASILFFGGTIALLGVSTLAAVARVRNGNLKLIDCLTAVVVSGVLATIVASFFVGAAVNNFDVLRANYSVWLLVPISLLVGASATSVTGFRLWDVAGRKVATGALLAGAGISIYLFFENASLFVHGPHRFISAIYDKAVGPKAIVYENGAAWVWSYLPLHYTHHGEVVQYWAPNSGGGLVRAGPRGTEGAVQEVEATLAPYHVLLLVDIRLRTYRDLRQCLNQPGACADFPSGAIERALIDSGKWQKTEKNRNFGFWDSKITIVERSEN